jgi:cobaltochelatase CobS
MRQRGLSGVTSSIEPTTQDEKIVRPDLFLPDKTLEKQLITCMATDYVMMVGPTGCGKTSEAWRVAEQAGVHLNYTKFHDEMQVSDLMGHPIITPEKMIGFSYGILPRSMNPKMCGITEYEESWLLVDEIDAAPPRVLFKLFGALEDHHSVYIDETGELVKATTKFRIIATANTKGDGDESGRFIRQLFDEAFVDRWTILECGYTPHEKRLLEEKVGVSAEVAIKIMEVVNLVRTAVDNEEIRMGLSTRRILEWGRKIKSFSVKEGTQIAIINRLNKEDASAYKGILQRVMSINI